MILLEPELEDGVDEGVGVSISLYDVLFGQRLLIPADGLWRAKRISSVNVLCIEMAFSVRDGNQHVDLGNGEAINVSLKDRSIGVNEQDGCSWNISSVTAVWVPFQIKKLNCWTYQL